MQSQMLWYLALSISLAVIGSRINMHIHWEFEAFFDKNVLHTL
jgi:hypothetical protein